MTDPIGESRQVGHFFNAIRHHDGCRLVHPAKWDIGKFRGAFVTNADWCIPSGDSFIYQPIHIYSVFHLSHFSSNFTFVLSFQRYTQSMYLFHILIHVLISYTHSRILIHILIYVYSFTYTYSCILIHIFIHVYSFTCTHSYAHLRILIHILIYVYSFTYTHSYNNLRILIHVYSFMYTYSYIHSRILIHVYSFICSFTYTHSYISYHLLSFSGYM